MPTKLFVPGLGRVDIPDDVPIDQTRKYIEGIAQQRKVELSLPTFDATPVREETETAGPIEALVGGTKRLLSSQFTTAASPFVGSTEAAVSGLERQRGIEERPATSLDEVTRRYEEEGFFPAAKEVISQVPGAIAEQVPFFAEMYAGAKAGAALPVPPQFRPLTTVGGALAFPLATAFGSGTERQVAEQMKRGETPEVDVEKALTAAVPSAALDVIEGRIAFGRGIVGKLLGKTDDEIAAASKKATEKELRKLAEEGVLGSIARGGARTAAFEVPAEMAQQALERWQAGLPLTNDEALKEYGEAAYGAALASPVGVVGRFGEKGVAREEVARRDAMEEFERSTPNIEQITTPFTSELKPESVAEEAVSFFDKVDKEAPQFSLNDILDKTGESVSNIGDAAEVANELLRRGEIVQQPVQQFSVFDANNNLLNTFDDEQEAQQEAETQGGSVFAQPTFRFLKDEEKIVPTLSVDQPYVYATPVTKEVASEPEGYEVYNQAIEVSRKAKTEEEAERIKTAMDARVQRMTTDIDKEIKGLEDNLLLIQEGLNIAVASNMPDEKLAEEYDRADLQQKEAQVKLDALKTQKEVLSGAKTEVTSVGMKPVEEQGYEVRLYRPGQSAKVVLPFSTRENAEQFIIENAPEEQQRAIFEDTAPYRASLREAQKIRYAPESVGQPAEQIPAQPLPEQPGVAPAATPTVTQVTTPEVAPVEPQTVTPMAEPTAPESVEVMKPETPQQAQEQQVVPQPTPEIQQRVQAVTSRLRGVLDQMGLQDVGLRVSNKLETMVNGQMTPVDGFYLDRVVNASLSSSRGVLGAFGHETTHALRDLGMFSDKEWNILTRKAKDEWMKKYAVGDADRYGNLGEEEQIEEAISDAFGDWMGGEYKPTGAIRGLLNRIKMFLESMGSVLRGQGFDNTEKIFQRAMRGELKGAAARAPSKAKYAVPLEEFENLSPESQRVLEEDFLYSPLNRFILNAPKKLEGQGAINWLQWLKANEQNYGGKQGELFWTGLDDWLTNQGKNKVSQEQIVQYLKDFDNPRDVVYESAGRPEIGVMDVTDQLPELVDPFGDPVDAAYEFIVTVGGNDFSFVAYERKSDAPYSLQLYDVNNDFMNAFSDIDSVKQELAYEANESLGAQGNTKFSEWTLDGGDNYREIPVTLSGPAAKKVDFDFYGTHWPDANVIYHLRTNDRQDIFGDNVLFVEEVQSDWAQKGREEGFVDPEIVKAAKEKRLPSGWEVVSRNFPAAPGGQEERAYFVVNENKEQVGLYTSTPEAAIAEALDRLLKGKGKDAVPRGPYVQDTSKWVELAAKRIIAMAVSGGYDKVAFINPDQAHKRFPKKKDGGSTKEGFENFYGKILPNKLNSLLQKYGSKVEVMQLPVIGDADKWVSDGDVSQQLGFVVTPELAASVRQRGFPKLALPLKVTAQGEKQPTLNANGVQIHPTKSGVRNFWRWFGDGQLVDSVGRPRLFYHGSIKDLEKFKKGTADAIFFAPNPGPMQTFINYKVYKAQMNQESINNQGVVYPVYINAKNIFDFENPSHVEQVVEEVMRGAKSKLFGITKKVFLRPYYSVKTPTDEGVEEEFFVAPESVIAPLKYSKEAFKEKLELGHWPTFETGEVIEAIKKLGFDSFFVTELFGGQLYKNVAVFSPNQIKSAVGNNGLFEPQDPRIQYALQRPKNQIAAAIRAASKPVNPRQDPLFETPFKSHQAGVNVFSKGLMNTPTLKEDKNAAQRFIENYGSKALQFFQLSGITDIYGDRLKTLRPYYNAIREMMGGRDIYLNESEPLSDTWQRLNARSLEDGNKMATVMNRATFYRYDPSKDPGNKNQRQPKTAEEIEIQRMFDSLPEPYKKLYVDVRNFYRKRFDDFFKLLEQRVQRSVKDPERAAQLIEALKQKYNYYNTIEPYFPLTRFGDYWVRYTEDGQAKFEMFENASDQSSFRNKLMLNPSISNIEVGKKIGELQGEVGAADFVGKIMQSLDDAKGGFMGQAQIDDLKDSVWQLYLQNLPELSMRKQFLHRANVPGYSNDALRAFQKNAYHGAYHMARLRFGPEVYEKLNDIRKEVQQLQKTNAPDAVKMTEVLESVASDQRQKQIWNPDDPSWMTRFAGKMGFLYFLSSIASSVTNMAQNFTHAFPIIGGEFGYDRATKEFSRAYKQFFESPSFDDFSDIKNSKSAVETAMQADKGIRSIFDMTRTLKQLQEEAKTPAEKEKYAREIDAIETLYQTVIARTQAMDLAGATDRVTLSQNIADIAMRFISMAFHGAEVLNRTTTGIVAYRLQMEKLNKEQPGMSVEERHQNAIRRASEIVDQSHYNYSEANRSPFMGSLGGLGKVVFMFKSYAVAETTFLYNMARVWSQVIRARWKGTPLEQKAIDASKQAKRTLLGVLGMQATFAGVLGLPTPLMMIVMGLANIMGSDEDDEDLGTFSQVRFKRFLVDMFGDNLAQAIAYGPLSYVTGADFNARVGLNSLWFRDPNPAEDEIDQFKNTLLALGGPMVGLAENIITGSVMMQQGQVGRGFEKMVPNIVKAPLQSIRYGEEGATTAKGDVILDDFSTSEKAMSFFGFMPLRLSLEYKQQSEMRGAMFKANLEKKRILIRFNMAVRSGDYDSLEDIQDDIYEYNSKYPSIAITGDTLKRSLKATASARRETVKGLRIPKKQRSIAEGVSWLDAEED
jgi:hypothetical protein